MSRRPARPTLKDLTLYQDAELQRFVQPRAVPRLDREGVEQILDMIFSELDWLERRSRDARTQQTAIILRHLVLSLCAVLHVDWPAHHWIEL